MAVRLKKEAQTHVVGLPSVLSLCLGKPFAFNRVSSYVLCGARHRETKTCSWSEHRCRTVRIIPRHEQRETAVTFQRFC